jgi:PAS domain S-box-containing protein
MNDVTTIQAQVENFVLQLASRIARIYDALRQLERLTRVVIDGPQPSDEEVAAWVGERQFASEKGLWESQPALARYRAGERDPGAFGHFLPGVTWQDPEVRRRLCALQRLYPLVADLRAALPGVAWVYYQEPTNLALTCPFLDFSALVDANYDWRTYHSYVSVAPDNNPSRRIRWTPPNVDYGGEGLITTASLPLWCDDRFEGLWSIDVPLRTIHQNCIEERLAPRQDNFILDLDGNVVVHSSLAAAVDREAGAVFLQPVSALGGDFSHLDAREMARRGHGRLTLRSAAGEDLEVVFEAIPDIDWVFVATIPRRDLLDTFNQQIARALGRIRSGDLGFRLDAPAPDNMRELVDGFNAMSAALALQETERRRAEEALAAEKERLDVTLLSIADGFIATDTQLRVVLMNPAAERITGWSSGDAIGRPLDEVMVDAAGDDLPGASTRAAVRRPDALAAAMRQALERHQPLEPGPLPSAMRTRQGRDLLVRATAAPIRVDRAAPPLGLAVVFRDVTNELRVTEELLKASKLESIGVLAGGIAHDFNNLLTAILGNVSLAQSVPGLPADTPDLLREAERATVRARDLALQLLTFARGGAPSRRSTSLPELLSETLGFVLRGTSVVAQVEVPRDLWPVDADEGQLSQVLNNLALNAVQAMPGGGHLRVRAENHQLTLQSGDPVTLRAGRYVRVSVSDTGGGISPEHLDRIFDPYFTTKPGGTGLGLATAFSIVRHHGGALTVESQLGRGSTFHVYLPASRRPAPIATAEPASAPQTGAGGRILVMDDEEAIRTLLGRMLEFLGYEPFLTADGEEAIAACQAAQASRRPFRAAILDLTVPGRLGGVEALREIRRLQPDLFAIAASGYATDPVLASPRSHGFRGVLAKPFDVDGLSRALQGLEDG